jgi:hypothetical protein
MTCLSNRQGGAFDPVPSRFVDGKIRPGRPNGADLAGVASLAVDRDPFHLLLRVG